MSAQKITLALLQKLRACYFYKPTGDPDRLKIETALADGRAVTFAAAAEAWPNKADVVWLGCRVLPLVVVRKFAKNCAGRAKKYASATSATAAEAAEADAYAAAANAAANADDAAVAAGLAAAFTAVAAGLAAASAASDAVRSAERDLQVKDLLALKMENK